MIRLGDVNFALGADTRGLRPAVQELQRFGTAVERVQTTVTNSSTKIANDFRKQERAAVSALDKTLRLTQQMRKVDGGDVFARRASAAFSDLNRALSRGQLDALQYQRAMERFRASLSNVTRDFKVFSDQAKLAQGGALAASLKSLQSGFVVLQGPLGGISTRIATLSSLMGTAGGAITAFVAGVAAAGLAIYNFGQSILTTGKQVNAFTGQFESVTGSIEGAEATLRKVIAISRLTGQSVESLAPAFAKFSIAAQGTGLSAKEVDKAFTTLAMAATKLQLPAEQSEGIFRALEQMLSKGTVQAEELRGQLGDRLAGAVQISARAMGVSTQKLQEMMKAGSLVTTDFLPKFIDQLAQTLRLDISKPIDNYTAAANNASTAWFQLTAKMDQSLKVTEKVMNVYKALTRTLDYVRNNLDTIKLAAVGVTGALAGFAAPALIGGILALGKAIGTLTLSLGTLNKVLNASVLGTFVRLAAVIAGAGTALYQFRDEIRPISGEFMTLGDYAKVFQEDLAKAFDLQGLAVSALATMRTFSGNMKLSWKDVVEESKKSVIIFTSDFSKGFKELMLTADVFFNNMMADIKTLASALNETRKWFSPWIDDPVGGRQSNKGFDWFEKTFGDKEYVRKSWKELQDEVDKIWKSPQDNTIQDMLNGMDLKNRARAKGMERIYGDPTRAQDIYKAPEKTAEEIETIKTVTELTDRQVKALDRKNEAMQRINDEIERQKEEVEALGGTEAGLEALTEKFKREKEVEKYGRALRKAGVDTEFIRDKTAELNKVLEKKDALIKYREGLTAFRDAFANAFDTISNSIVDGLFEGENALKSFLNVAKDVAKDILKTWLQLSLLNPLKNALFGLNEPTLQGGILGNIGKIFNPGAGSGAGTAAAGMGVAANDVVPAIAQGIRGSRMSNIFKPAGFTKTGIPLAQIESQGLTAKVNAQYAERFQGLLNDLEKQGYKIKSLGEGGYSYRNVKGTNNLSKHSFGEAIDINPRQNPWSHKFQTDLPPNINELAKKNGLTWGGTWRKPDTMHFQVDKSAKIIQESFENTAKSVKLMGDSSALTTNSIKVAQQGIEGFGGGLGKLGQNLATMNLGGASGGGGGGIFGIIGNFFKAIFGIGGAAGGTGIGGGGGIGGGASIASSMSTANSPLSSALGDMGAMEALPANNNSEGRTVVPMTGGNVIIHIHASDGQTATVKKSTNSSGDNVVDVFIQQAKQAIAGDISKGGTEINSAIEGRYALRSAAGIK